MATLLVEIAEEMYVFGSVPESVRDLGDPEPTAYVWAAPKSDEAAKRALADIRDDLAAEYLFRYDAAPNTNALADAMTVLMGRARKNAPAVDVTLAGLLRRGPKESVSTHLVQLAEQRYRLGISTTGQPYAVPSAGPNVARPLRGGRRSLRAELTKLYFEQTKSAANAQALADALLVLEGKAQAAKPTELALRVAQVGNALVLDLGGDDGQVVVVRSAGDWAVQARSPVLFWRTNATLRLPVPGYDGSLDPLRALLNVSGEDWPLLVAWLVLALMPDVPHPVLGLSGEQGCAKSTAARLLTALVDPSASQLRTAPRNIEDWCVAAAASWITCLDNLSDLQPWLQDSVCEAVTGDGLLRRQVYSDSDVSVLAFRRVITLTSIDAGTLSGDLADRMLSVELQRITQRNRGVSPAGFSVSRPSWRWALSLSYRDPAPRCPR
jgi:hypothetical protein